MTLAGSWRIANPTEPSTQTYGAHAYYFSPHGELVLSTGIDPPQRILLTWREDAGCIVTDQPSAPREARMPLLRASEVTMQLGTSWYLRDERSVFDPEAAWWALVAGGTWHGIASAHPDGPFHPFLMLETGTERRLERIIAGSSAEAQQVAQEVLATEAYERAVWVRDGRVTVNGTKMDAIVTSRYAPHGTCLSNLTLPYKFRGETAVIAGSFYDRPAGVLPSN